MENIFEKTKVLTGDQWEAANVRVTVLTSRLIRIETDVFTDEKTQIVMNRKFPDIKANFRICGNYVAVRTEKIYVRIDPINGKILGVKLEDGHTVFQPELGNLLGTARTLDNVDGAKKLESGIMSRSGTAILDDSKSLLLKEDPEEEIKLVPREGGTDRYLFAYGNDYISALKDFYILTGPVPLIPRYALGNWWSRYKAYTQEEYVNLIQRFKDRKIPLTVATIDMDWHWVKLKDKFDGSFGSDIAHPSQITKIQDKHFPGWTGYSWNTDLFPNHQEMLDWLHEQKLKVTLNIHPAQGVRWFEDRYEELCQHLGWDPKERRPIPFNLISKEQRHLYFEKLHRVLEKEGVDFWWIDWQQGTETDIKGLDPLWLLNHFHYEDNSSDESRPLILSRYSGMGSHRYPLGFSGDVVVSWRSLDFQPYFTANAANAGYPWWSHDIGGHMFGNPSEELYLRWIQLGVFSPINRLHSTDCEYMSKEPWMRTRETERTTIDYLRLRHRLIPYLYSANYLTAFHGRPLCEPMYYQNPDKEEAYKVRNQFYFGPSLMVAPITRPVDRATGFASVHAWLPEGRYTDIFTGQIYQGPGEITLFREKTDYPVLAKEGSILPLYKHAEENDLSLDQDHEIWIYRGNGSFDWYEDDGESESYRKGQYMITRIQSKEISEGESKGLLVTIRPKEGDLSVIPAKRHLTLRFRDISDVARITVNGVPVSFKREIREDGRCEVLFDLTYKNAETKICLEEITVMKNLPLRQEGIRRYTMYQSDNLYKIASSHKKSYEHFEEKGHFPAKVEAMLEELRDLWKGEESEVLIER